MSNEDQEQTFSPLQIGYIADVVEPVNAATDAEKVLKIFEVNKREAVPIEQDGEIEGILLRRTLEKTAGISLDTGKDPLAFKNAWQDFWKNGLNTNIIRTKKVIDATTYIDNILEEGLKQESFEATWYVVQHRQRCLGIVSFKKILKYTNSLHSQDLHRASEIQKRLLQKSLVTDKRFNLYLFNKMANEVGGDFYRVYRPDKDHAVVGCFDVSGKNISGALTTMALGTCFTSFELFQYMSTPDKTTNLINALIRQVCPPGIFVACALFYIDFILKHIRIHNCGFSPILIFVPQPNNKVTYKVSNPTLPPLGIDDEYDYSDSLIIPITGGLRLCAYSDGFTDMLNIRGERYGEEQATKTIKRLHTAAPADIRRIIFSEIDNWIGTAALADDVTFLDMRFN